MSNRSLARRQGELRSVTANEIVGPRTSDDEACIRAPKQTVTLNAETETLIPPGPDNRVSRRF